MKQVSLLSLLTDEETEGQEVKPGKPSDDFFFFLYDFLTGVGSQAFWML